MTTEQKVTLVAGAWQASGLQPALAAVDLPKSTWYYHQHTQVSYPEKYADLRPILEEIILAHPEYGVPRIMPELRETYDVRVNHKVIERLLRIWDLSLLRSTHHPPPSAVQRAVTAAGADANLVAHQDEIGLFDVMYTDFTELPYADGRRKAFLIPLLAHTSKLVYGWAVGAHANTSLALAAWEDAKTTLRRLEVPYRGMILHHDQDTVFTSYAWTAQLLLDDGVRLSYALRGAKDNPQIEAFNSRFKDEGRSLFLAAPTLADLVAVVNQRLRYYNRERRHSAIGQVAPLTYLIRVCSESSNAEG